MIQRIMIVDDCLLLARALRRRLTKSGYSVTTVTNASDAIRTALAPECGPDFALMDINLGTRISGIHLGTQFRALGIPFMYMTGGMDEVTLARAAETKPIDIALKNDLSVDVVIRAIQKVSHGPSARSSH